MDTSSHSSKDFLRGVAARFTTPLPGHWLFDLPIPGAKILIRRYRFVDPPTSLSNTSDGILTRLRDDALEIAWRNINSLGEFDLVRGVKGILGYPCCVISNGVDDGKDEIDPLHQVKSVNRRELWCFGSGGGDEDGGRLDGYVTVPGLQEVFPRLRSIDPTHLINCSKHGRDMQCLNSHTGPSDRQNCKVDFRVPVESRQAWDLFGHAVAGKLAWKTGTRLFSLPGPFTLSDMVPIKIRITPFTSSSLLLVVDSNPLPRCLPVSSPSPRLDPMMLKPLHLPALLLGPLTLNSQQEAQVTLTFETVLGQSWKNGRSENRLSAQLSAELFSDWSAFWVPLLPAEKSLDKTLAKMSADQVVRNWQQCQGVITIWPSHLIHHLSTITSPKLPKQDPPAVFNQVSSDDLLSTATSLFDFMSSYQEPVAMEEVEMNDEVDEVSFDENDDMEVDQPPNQNGDDIDDLFSSHTASPPADPPPQDPQDIDSLFGISRPVSRVNSIFDDGESDVEGEVQQPDAGIGVRSHIEKIDEKEDQVDEIALRVTEDDFDFFDSPADLADHSMDVEAPLEQIEEVQEQVETVELPQPRVSSPAPASDVAIVVEETAVELVEAEAMETAQQDVAHTSPAVELRSTPPPVDTIPSNSEPLIVKSLNPFPKTEIIPTSFEPILLANARSTLPSFTYSLPSPAPTPEALRPELYDRLKPKSSCYDYAADWEAHESDSSESEDMEDYSGAPPTPTSDFDTSDSPSRESTPSDAIEARTDAEIRFSGSVAIGAEWTVLKDDLDTSKLLAKGWNHSWSGSSVVVDQGSVNTALKPREQNRAWTKINLDRLSDEIISNPQFRKLLSFDHDSGPEHSSSPLLRTGTVLSDLAVTSFLNAPSIHTGYAGKVMQISIAALRYWRELGLQPVGGKKDVTAFVICEPLAAGIAGAMIRKIGVEYELSRLGRHMVGVAGNAQDGTISCPMADWGKQIDTVQQGREETTVIYLLLPVQSARILQQLAQLLFAPKAHPKCVIHLLPSSTVHVSQYHQLALEVYSRLPISFQSVLLRGLRLSEEPITSKPAFFTLALETPPKPALTLQWPLKSFDVMNKWRMSHGAYGYAADLGFMVACIVDTQGEGYNVKTWVLEGHEDAKQRVLMVLKFFVEFAERGAADFRLTVSSLGLMGIEEVEAWRNLVDSRPNEPMTVFMVESPSLSHDVHALAIPRQAVPNVSAALLNDPLTTIIDESLIANSAIFTHRLPIELPSSTTSTKGNIIYPRSSFILSITSTLSHLDHMSSVYRMISHRPIPQGLKVNEEDVDGLMLKEFYRLCCLARRRFGFENTGLPIHLEGVRSVLGVVRHLAGGS